MLTCLAIIPTLLVPIFMEINGHLSEQEQVNLCAQIRQESLFDCNAVSPAGARGCTQFMRPTWGDVGPRVGCPDWNQALDPKCSIKAQADYMRTLLGSLRCRGVAPKERWYLAWACYNAGLGSIGKERSRCALLPGCDPRRWVGNVEKTCMRRPSACRETRTYVERIRRFGGAEIAL